METATAKVTDERALDELCINTIRTLSMDAVQQANSGHPGTPMALAPVIYILWQNFLRFDPETEEPPEFDRHPTGRVRLYEEPEEGAHYVVSIDAAGGRQSSDYCVAMVGSVCNKTCSSGDGVCGQYSPGQTNSACTDLPDLTAGVPCSTMNACGPSAPASATTSTG